MKNLASCDLSDAQLLRNRGMAVSTRGADNRGPLALGQRGHRREHGSQVSTSGDFVGATAVLPLLVQLIVARCPGGELGERDIVRDRVQPRTQLANLDSRAQRSQSADERLLHGVLSLVVGEKRPAMAMQALPVTLDDCREGGIAASPRERHQDLVGLGD
jgi:hypothetical protein